MHPSRYPDFLVIGAQKAGTSWPFENLVAHPWIWLPPSKEIHYFNGLWPNSFLLDFLSRVCRDNPNNPDVDFEKLRWYADFALTHPRTDAWYGSLFASAGDKLAGDITPAYAMLDRAQVAHANRLMPAAKIVFIMRDPIDRIWSQFCFSASWRHEGIADTELTDERIITEVDTVPYDHRTIEHWESFCPTDQMLYLLYDDIDRDRARFLSTLCAFLNIDPVSDTMIERAKEKRM